MEKIERLLKEHYSEFTEMINELYDEKYPSKKEKIICSFKIKGKYYNSNIFTKNYKSFLNDLSNVVGGKVFKQVLGNYVKFDSSDFSKSIILKGQYENINNVFHISTYSSTETKIKHIQDLCKFLDIPVRFEYMNTLEMA
jgi:hypothetical protein